MQVNLKKKCKLDGRWAFYPVLKENGKLRLDRIVVAGQPQPSKAGTFYIEWRENGKRRQEPVGKSPRAALDAMRTMSVHLNSEDRAEHPSPLETAKTKRGMSLEAAYTQFLTKTHATRTPGTFRDYRQAIDWLRDVVAKKYVSEITKLDLVALFALGRKQGFSQTTINKRVIAFLAALRGAGSDLKMGKGEWPKIVSRMAHTYTVAELETFFKACDARERIFYQTYLLTGFRRREGTTLTWQDVASSALRVVAKPDLKFYPKNYEERTVPVPRKLIEAIQSLPKSHRLIFPSKPHTHRSDLAGGNEDSLALYNCKVIAHKAGLNCGQCKDKHGQSCADGPVCDRWFLHKFRHTFATQMIESGVNLKRLQLLLGHKQLATTEKYLRSIGIGDMAEQIENSSLAKLL
jgi:integrase/recombinase XerD